MIGLRAAGPGYRQGMQQAPRPSGRDIAMPVPVPEFRPAEGTRVAEVVAVIATAPQQVPVFSNAQPAHRTHRD